MSYKPSAARLPGLSRSETAGRDEIDQTAPSAKKTGRDLKEGLWKNGNSYPIRALGEILNPIPKFERLCRLPRRAISYRIDDWNLLSGQTTQRQIEVKAQA
jgi:hypothetical protein